MDTIGPDLHKRESQLCMGHDNGASPTSASCRAASASGRCSGNVTESGAASAWQVIAAGRGRRLVGAVRSFVPPRCAEVAGPHAH